jgi:hypothetical protein
MSRFRTLFRFLSPMIIMIGAGVFASTAGALTPNPSHIERRPVLGWSSWSAFRFGANAAIDKAEVNALVRSGLKAEGFDYINQDDGWYQCPKVSYTGDHRNYGPTVDRWGRWVTSQKNTPNTGAFPNHGAVNGIKAVADYVHSRGLKFGIYLTPGISGNALSRNTPVEANAHGQLLAKPSGYTADQITLGYTHGLKPSKYTRKLTDAENYNCGGTWELNYKSPGAQQFVDGEADEFASWGVDYVKLDGILDHNTTDLRAWSKALAQSGRKIALDTTEGAYDTAIVPQLNRYANQWEYTPDVEEGGDKKTLTGYPSVYLRFNSAALWEHFGGPKKGFNDLDSVEVGNGQTPAEPRSAAGVRGTDGLTLPARESVLSLWSLAASPLILGTDLRQLNATQNPVDLALLRNRRVIGIDQDGISAKRVSVTADSQVFSKREPNGEVIVGLFNTDYTQPEVVSTTATKVGLPAGGPYEMRDLWGDNSDLCAAPKVLNASPTPKTVKAPLCSTGSPGRYETAGAISAEVPAEGVALYEFTPLHPGASSSSAGEDVPSTTLDLSGVARLTAGQPATATVTFTNNGTTPVSPKNLSFSTPAGWTATARSCPGAGDIAPGQTVTASFAVTAPSAQTNARVMATAGPASASSPRCQPTTPMSGAPASGTTSVSDEATVAASPVVINEVQTGSRTKRNQQFVELYNPGTSVVNISGWRLQYQAQLAPNGVAAPTVLARIPQGTSLVAGGYYLIGGAGYAASSGQPPSEATFASKSLTALSGIGGALGLRDARGALVDSVGWGVADNEGFAPSAFQRASGAFVQDCPAQARGVVPTVITPGLTSRISTHPTPPSIPNGDSLVRLPNGQDTGSNCRDFSVTRTPSPGAANGS